MFRDPESHGKEPLSAVPGGVFPRPGHVGALHGGGKTSGELVSPDALSGAEPWSDESLRAFFLGSLGTNVTKGDLQKLIDSHPCGPAGGWFVSRETRRQWPARCRRLRCSYCLPKEAAIRQLILSESMPDSTWSQTMVADAKDPDPWPVVRHRMNLLFHYYRRKAKMREMSYVVEMNPNATGYHVHAVCHGAHWNIPLLKECQVLANLGTQGNKVMDIYARHDAAGYGLKGFSAAGYGLKGFDAYAAGQEALRINGGRLEHHTKGFIRVNGKPATIAVARAAIMQKKYGKLKGDAVWKSGPVGEYYFDVDESKLEIGKPQSLLDDM